jgi:hypothetical protein
MAVFYLLPILYYSTIYSGGPIISTILSLLFCFIKVFNFILNGFYVLRIGLLIAEIGNILLFAKLFYFN